MPPQVWDNHPVLSGEIVDQVYRAVDYGGAIHNLVYMGMGETMVADRVRVLSKDAAFLLMYAISIARRLRLEEPAVDSALCAAPQTQTEK